MSRYDSLFWSVLFILSFCGCTKQGRERGRESFKFVGYVKDCVSGTPIAGARIQIIAERGSAVFTSHDDVGETTTDANGYYEIYPYTTNIFHGTHWDGYDIRCSFGSSGESEKDIDNDSVRRGGTEFQFDFVLSQASTLRIKVNNQNPDGALDTLFLNVRGTGPCASNMRYPYHLTNYYGAVFSYPNIYYNFFPGKVQNTMVEFAPLGNDTALIKYWLYRNGSVADTVFQKVWCAENRLTEFSLNY